MGRLALCETSGPLTDLLQKLSGEGGGEWLEYLNKMLRKENPFNVAMGLLPSLDWRKPYELLGVTAQEFEVEMARLAISECDDFWTVPFLKILRKEGKKGKEVPLVTCNRIVQVYQDLGKEHDFTVYQSYGDLDTKVTVNARDPNRDGSYAIKVCRAIEPDRAPKLLSYDKPEEFVNEETALCEELFLELAYFVNTGEHLNVKKVARCGSSRCLDGDVPHVNFYPADRRLYVSFWNPDNTYPRLLSRSVSSPRS